MSTFSDVAELFPQICRCSRQEEAILLLAKIGLLLAKKHAVLDREGVLVVPADAQLG